MATIPTQIKQRFLVLLAELTGFDGKVLSGKLDVFETPTASVYLGKQEASRESMRESITERSQLIQVVISDTVANSEEAEDHLLTLGEALEQAVEADSGNMPSGVNVDLAAQESDINPDTPRTGVITQVYEAAWTQTL